MAIDRELLVAGRLRPGRQARPATWCRRPAAYASDNTGCLKQDIEGAKKLLDEAGWKPGPDGIRVKDGKKLVLTYQTSTNAVRQDTQSLIKQWWKEIGVDAQLKNVNASVFFGGDPGSPDTFQKFYTDVEMYANNFAGTDPQAYMAQYTCDKAPRPETQWQGENINRYCDKDYDALVSAARPDRRPREARRARQEDERHADQGQLHHRPADLARHDLGRRQLDRRRGRSTPGTASCGTSPTGSARSKLTQRAAPALGGGGAPLPGTPSEPSAYRPRLPCRGTAMLNYVIRRLLISIPVLLLISLIIFLLLNLAPGDPLANQPLTIPPEVREKMKEALGLGQPIYVRYVLWLKQFFWVEPLHFFDWIAGTHYSAGMERILSWQFRSPVFDVIVQRLPQTLTVVGMSYLIGVSIALPIGIISAYRQYSWFDQAGTFISMVGFSVPTFFTGVLLIVIFSVKLGWFPSIYDTKLRVHDWASFLQAGEADGDAGGGAGALQRRADQPLHARLDARQPATRTTCAPRAPRA